MAAKEVSEITWTANDAAAKCCHNQNSLRGLQIAAQAGDQQFLDAAVSQEDMQALGLGETRLTPELVDTFLQVKIRFSVITSKSPVSVPG